MKLEEYRKLIKSKKKNKFGAVACKRNGIRFHSKLERAYYDKLETAKHNGDLLFFLMQVPFKLPGNITYRMDFMEFWKPENGDKNYKVVFTEIKGKLTEVSKIKMKQCCDMYKIDINVVYKV